ncbi:MAG: hypothetical protein IGR92_01590 [Leptolyngbyaceae cyanobacterium T60_A2020_046]|nr:hypothetical protein [Leptolyngbyaceae cyanobacterium T60_A2020_046]
MTVFLRQFRDRYPTAGLCSEVLESQAGRFVVRVTIQLETAVLATGLAADAVLETAEDRARHRAIAALGIGLTVDAVTLPRPDPQASPGKTGVKVPSPLSHPAEPPETPLAITPEPDDLEESPWPEDPGRPAVATVAPTVQQAPPQTTLAVTDAGTKPKPKPQTKPQQPAPEKPAALKPQPSEGKAATPLPPTLPEIPLASPVDLSDVIAQTGVELRRLGWSVEQGREYLEKTYGKRSRHDLSDEELLEFLLYLETLPTPAEVGQLRAIAYVAPTGLGRPPTE